MDKAKHAEYCNRLAKTLREKEEKVRAHNARILEVASICGPYEKILVELNSHHYYATFPSSSNLVDIIEYISDAGYELIPYDEYNIVYLSYGGIIDEYSWCMRINHQYMGTIEIRVRVDGKDILKLYEYSTLGKVSKRFYANTSEKSKASFDIYAKDTHQQYRMMKYINELYEAKEGDTYTSADS